MTFTTDSTTEYARAVVEGRKEMACKAEVQACQRHLNDLTRTDIVWKPAEAEKHIRFAELLTYYDKNEKARKPVKLRGFERFIIGNVFGWYYPTGARRYSQAYIQVARKNGKTALSGMFCTDYAIISGIRRAQIYTAGTNYANARRTYDAVVDYIESDPELNELFTIQDYKNIITANDSKATIKALSGETGGPKDGFQPTLSIVDELHIHKTDEMYNVLLDGQVGLTDSLIVAATTAGFDLNGPCYKMYKYCKNILRGTAQDDSLFIYIAECDLPDAHREADDYERELWNEKRWAQANPLLLYDETGLHITDDPTRWQKFRSSATKAKEEGGSALRDFITKKLNCWTVVGSEKYIDPQAWERCGSDKTIKDLAGKRAFIGLDLSSKNDLTTWAMIFPPQDGVNKPYIYSMSYLPKDTLQAHIRKDRAPYDYWYKAGWLKLTDCNGRNGYILDYKAVIADIKATIKEYNISIVMILYDPMGISAVLADLEEICAECVEVGQYPRSMNDATRNFRDTVKAGGVEYDKTNGLMTWSIQNAETVETAKRELIVDKRAKRERIDPVDAILNGWKGAMTEGDMQARSEIQKANLEAWAEYMRKI